MHVFVGVGNNRVAEAFLVISLLSIHSPPLNLHPFQPLDTICFTLQTDRLHSVGPVLHAGFGRLLQRLSLLHLSLLVARITRQRTLLLNPLQLINRNNSRALLDRFMRGTTNRGGTHAYGTRRHRIVVSGYGLGTLSGH